MGLESRVVIDPDDQSSADNLTRSPQRTSDQTRDDALARGQGLGGDVARLRPALDQYGSGLFICPLDF